MIIVFSSKNKHKIKVEKMQDNDIITAIANMYNVFLYLLAAYYSAADDFLNRLYAFLVFSLNH